LHEGFDAEKLTIQQVAAELAKRLHANKYCDDLWEPIERLECLSTDDELSQYELVDWYDGILNDLYNFGDEDYRIWFEPS